MEAHGNRGLLALVLLLLLLGGSGGGLVAALLPSSFITDQDLDRSIQGLYLFFSKFSCR
jgi:hypothetical protein